MFHARIQELFSARFQAHWPENSLDNVVFFYYYYFFFSPQLILHFTKRGSNGFITEKTMFFQGFSGGPTFPGGSNFF